MEKSNDECIFCKIIRGELPSKKVYEDEHCYCFLSIKPDNAGHTLVIPRKHVRNVLDADPETLHHVMDTVQHIARDMIKNGAKAVKISQNNEKPLQEVFHLHFHVVPY